MNLLIKGLLFSFFFLFFSLSYAQPMQYTYDAAGNRIKKEIDLNPGQLRKKSVLTDQVGTSEIKIYPNPTTEMVKVEIAELSEGQNNIQIIDMSGRLIKEIQSPRVVNEISFSSEAKGKYILRLTNGEEVSNWVIIKH